MPFGRCVRYRCQGCSVVVYSRVNQDTTHGGTGFAWREMINSACFNIDTGNLGLVVCSEDPEFDGTSPWGRIGDSGDIFWGWHSIYGVGNGDQRRTKSKNGLPENGFVVGIWVTSYAIHYNWVKDSDTVQMKWLGGGWSAYFCASQMLLIWFVRIQGRQRRTSMNCHRVQSNVSEVSNDEKGDHVILRIFTLWIRKPASTWTWSGPEGDSVGGPCWGGIWASVLGTSLTMIWSPLRKPSESKGSSGTIARARGG